MTEKFEISVVNGVATKKKYVSPEIEVVNLDEQPKLLAQSVTGGASWSNGGILDDGDWDE